MQVQTCLVRLRDPASLFFRRDPVALTLDPFTLTVTLAEHALPLAHLHLAHGLGRHELVLTTRRLALTVAPAPAHAPAFHALVAALRLAARSPPGFLLLAELGRGSFATVFRAVHRPSGALVALKQVRKLGLRCPLSVARRELAILRRLPAHRNIVSVRHVFETRHALYVAMELVPGGELLDYVAPRTLPAHAVADVMRQLLAAVAHLHAHGVMHRDVKLENILVAGVDGDRLRIKLCDFGLAIDDEGEKPLNARVGTGYAQAPEMVLGAAADATGRARYGPPVDAWACGIVLFSLLYGRIPWMQKPKTRAAQMARMVELSRSSKGFIHVLQTIDERLATPKRLHSLLCGLLQPCPEKRLSARAALEHPALAAPEKSVADVPSPCGAQLRSAQPISLRQVALRVVSAVRAVESLQRGIGIPPASGGLMVV